MAQLKVERLVQINVYRCDGPNCDSECDDTNFPALSACQWKYVTNNGTGQNDLEQRRFFCSWTCVANWAMGKACQTGEITCAA